MNIVRLSEVRPSPWRNGGGSTRELLAWPDSTDWDWRLSVAEVAADGPFSRFDGVTRWFAVLQGEGVRLDIAGRVHDLTRSSPPLCFDGGLTTGCTLIAGATQDFNLMLRQGRAQARMLRVAGSHSVTLAATSTIAVYLAEGPGRLELQSGGLELQAGTLAWGSVAAGQTLSLRATDALWMEITS